MVKKNKDVPGELIYGIHPLVELLKAKRRKLISIYTTKPTPKQFSMIEKLMPQYPVQIQYVSRDVLTRMAGNTDHQGVVAWVQSYQFRKKPFDPEKNKFLLLLDSIQDTRNLGAILRSAYCTGIDGVLMTSKNSAPLNAVAIKSSAGLVEHLEIMLVPTAQQAVQELVNMKYTVYLATLDGKNASKIEYAMPACLVIGNEAIGITRGLEKFGTKVTLPQKTADISYNASVAAGILMFMMSTQKGLV